MNTFGRTYEFGEGINKHVRLLTITKAREGPIFNMFFMDVSLKMC